MKKKAYIPTFYIYIYITAATDIRTFDHVHTTRRMTTRLL